MIGLLLTYARQRFPLRVFVPVLGMLTALACWTTASPMFSIEAGRAALLTTGLVVLLRVWDDLEDRDIDRVAQPDRVLPRAPVGMFIFLQVGIGVGLVTLLLSSGSSGAAIGLAGLLVAAFVGYRVVRARVSPTVWPYVLLLKYPAAVAMVAQAAGPAHSGRLLAAILLTYVGAYAYEDLHTRPFADRIPRRD